MFQNYLKIAARNLYRHKGFSFINILGLVVGISFSCMLYIYVTHQLSYDSLHAKSNRTFRVLTVDERDAANTRTYGVTVPPAGPELVKQYPEVESMVRLHRFVGQVVLEHGGQNFQERNWYTTTDENFFDVFEFDFIHGDPATALAEPQSLVLTESTARKYFGTADVVGRIIEKTSFGSVTVTAVLADLPDNSTLQFDMLFSRIRSDNGWQAYINSWDEFGAYTYIVLHDRELIGELRRKMPELTAEKFARFDGGVGIDFQSIEEIYLGSAHIEEGVESLHGDIRYVYIFSSMGIFLLVIACINYINLATAKAMMRSREVGLRKVVGAARRQLVVQFLIESFLITGIATIAAVMVLDLAFPHFNQITGKNFDLNGVTVADYVPAVVIIALIMGLISGSYPAFYLSRLKPVSALRARTVKDSGNAGLRNALVIFQFVITIVMLVSTLTIGRQLDFIKTREIGFDKEKLMVIDINNGQLRGQFRAVKNEYAAIPGVQHVAVSSRVPGEWKNIPQLYVRGAAAESADSTQAYFMGFDEDMLTTMDMALADGRYFSHGVSDSTHVLLNESAVKALGLANPVGAAVRLRSEGGTAMNATVIGVIRDFHFQSLHQKIAPIVIGAWNTSFAYIDYFTLKISGDTEEVIRAATAVHDKFDQRTPIEYHFLDQQLESYYAAEQRAGMIFRMGGMLSILVACLGLFGLATYNIQRRTKELGVRKVVGASGTALFLLLSSSFAKQIFIAFLIAIPIAWYITTGWLSAFAYHIVPDLTLYLYSGMIALLIALATVSYRTLQAIRANPVEALRQE